MVSASTEAGHRLALDLDTFSLELWGGDAISDVLALVGSGFGQAHEWARRAVAEQGLSPDRFVSLGTDRLPASPMGRGGPFDGGDRAGRAELTRWFANTAGLLRGLGDTHTGAGPVLTWPHHCDMATLITVVPDPNPEGARTVGVGMSPGDDSYAEPYLYVTPWPYPEASQALLGLPVGHWHTEGWVGAVLTGSALLEAAPAQGQEAAAVAFLDVAVRAAEATVAG